MEGADDLANLERLRTRLEDNIEKLQKALNHWQTWDFEYEALKEEFLSLKNPSQDEVLKLTDTFGGDLVDEKEVKELSGISKNVRRTPQQIADVISRRQDYVRQNIETVSKQLETAQDKLDSLLGVKKEFEDESGLPIMDITEELDDDGNVISGHVAAPSQAASKIVEALDKAGVPIDASSDSKQDQQESGSGKITAQEGQTFSGQKSEPATKHPGDSIDTEWPEIDPALTSPANDPAALPQKKSVSFIDDTKPESLEYPQKSKTRPAKKTLDPDIASDFFVTEAGQSSRVIELDDDDLPIGSMPLQTQNETVEEAALRREMLQYGLQEVGAIVAEMNLEEGDHSDLSDYDEDEDYDDYDEDLDTDMEEEDEFGRSTRPVISDEYRQKMLDLEAQLGARMMENVGPRPENAVLEDAADEEETEKLAKSAHRLVVQKESASPPTPKPQGSIKKGVRFADELDISSKDNEGSDVRPAKSKAPSTFSDIVERSSTVSDESKSQPPSKGKKASRFKSERSSKTAPTIIPMPSPVAERELEAPAPVMPEIPRERTTPTGPKDQILSKSVIERDSIEPFATGPDELDPAMLRSQVEAEYHKMRNKMIQKQGGFLSANDEDDEMGELVEEKEDGTVKKVSKFRAARMKAAGL